ncbi:MAG TPA: hypothetical protein VFB04_17755 [Terriglobales bacterium]|nr:hypothetical protein [Terriglobales bacterium]
MKLVSSRSHSLQALLVAAVLLAVASPGASAQQRGHPTLPDPQQHSGVADSTDDWQLQQQKEMAKKANLQRQQDLKKDTEKLLELATELKQSVDKSSENTLSLDVIKKAEQIEKLAKTVKDRMKGP